MTEPTRITDRANAPLAEDDLGATMLRAARGDRPRAASRNRAAAAAILAIGAGAAGATTTTAAAAASSKLVSGGGALVIAKWLGISVIGASIAIGAVKYARDAETTPTANVAPLSTPAPLANANKPVRAMPSGPVPAAPTVAPATTAASSARAIAAASASPAAPASPASSAAPSAAPALSDEVRVLERARTALGKGDARGALDALDTYDRGFKNGVLVPEAAVLRIEALAQSGDDDAATTHARAFLAAFPDSPQERRVRSVLDTIAKKR